MEHRHPTDDLHKETTVNILCDRRKTHRKVTAFREMGKPGRVQVTKEVTRWVMPRTDNKLSQNRSYARSTEYMRAREWNPLGVEERTGTLETYKELIKREPNILLD